ncbi:MAG: hypothetical protein ACRDNF_13360 [Streptosporangiaceae bacterium]
MPSFPAPYRGLIALFSIVLFALALLLNLRTIRVCQLSPRPESSSGARH